jgi:Fur family transcriptional regulator, ferric uptake regulator
MQTQKEDAQAFRELLEKKGLKFTYERKCIHDEVMNLKDHFDADDLHERFKRKGLRISRDTVYRTLPLLLESRAIQKSAGAGKREFYERIGLKGHHDHMVCTRCGKVIEFQCAEIEKLQDKVCKQYDFQLTFHDHRLFGLCKDCVRQEG